VSPKRKHLKRLERLSPAIRAPVYFVTICTFKRKRFLANAETSREILHSLEKISGQFGWLVGRFVIMPDHIHFFCAPHSENTSLSDFVGAFKSYSTLRLWDLGIAGKVWQREFFDHLLRSDESYGEKWEYVRCNPVRQGLCKNPEQWPYQGEVSVLKV